MSTGPETRRTQRSPSAAPARPDPGAAGDPHPDRVRLTGQRQRLQDVASSLAQSLDPRAVASLILDAACDQLSAPQGWVSVVDDAWTTAEVLVARGYDDGAVGPWTRVPLELDTPMTIAIREGRTILHRSMAERHAAYPVLTARGSGPTGTEASAVIPLVFEGRTTGALAVGWTEVRDLDEDEAWFLESLAAHGSQSLERARLFAALREREERLRFALAASGSGTWTWTLLGGRLEWSEEISAIHGTPVGWAPDTFEAYTALIHPEDRARVRAAIEAGVDEGAPYDEEFRILRPDGTDRWIRGAGQVQLDEAGRPARMIGTATDIDARKRAEAERDRMLEAEREAARLRDAFVGIVSHELRTPITTIFGGTRVLARRWRDMPEDARDDILVDVVEEADRLYRLVEDLLVLTRVERGSLHVGDEPVHVGRVLARVAASERARWPGVTIETEVASGLPSIAGEDTYVEQVLRNLLGNAAKYGGAGSTVLVTAEASATAVTLVVLDEGPGIDEAETAELFELFYRSPSVAKTVSGAGIGLFVCRRLVTAMGGTLEARNRSTGGAAFIVTLPRYADDESG